MSSTRIWRIHLNDGQTWELKYKFISAAWTTTPQALPPKDLPRNRMPLGIDPATICCWESVETDD